MAPEVLMAIVIQLGSILVLLGPVVALLYFGRKRGLSNWTIIAGAIVWLLVVLIAQQALFGA